MTSVTAVVLAAGMSRRMGAANKLLLPVEGEPMIVRTLRAYLGACDDLLVVTGCDADKISGAIDHLDLRIVHNHDFQNGQATSVAAGLRAVKDADHVLIGLGDQPFLMRQHLDALMQAHLEQRGAKITVPHNGKNRGNPIVIPGTMLPALLQDKQNPGCGKFTRERQDLVNLTNMSEPAFFRDIDTPEEYAAYQSRARTLEDVS